MTTQLIIVTIPDCREYKSLQNEYPSVYFINKPLNFFNTTNC